MIDGGQFCWHALRSSIGWFIIAIGAGLWTNVLGQRLTWIGVIGASIPAWFIGAILRIRSTPPEPSPLSRAPLLSGQGH